MLENITLAAAPFALASAVVCALLYRSARLVRKTFAYLDGAEGPKEPKNARTIIAAVVGFAVGLIVYHPFTVTSNCVDSGRSIGQCLYYIAQ